jgi:hypothetical protein
MMEPPDCVLLTARTSFAPLILGDDGYNELYRKPCIFYKLKKKQSTRIPTTPLTERADGADSKCIQKANNR